MNPYKRIEALRMLEMYGHIDYTIMVDGQCIEDTANHIEDLEQACSVYGSECVFF